MARECSLGLMVEGMKENTMMIKNKDLDYLRGQMGEDMRAIGKMENNMEKELTTLVKAKSKKENGRKEKELNGMVVVEVMITKMNETYL